MADKKVPTMRDLYPNLSDEELRQAEENLGRYLELVLQIFQRTQKDGRD